MAKGKGTKKPASPLTSAPPSSSSAPVDAGGGTATGPRTIPAPPTDLRALIKLVIWAAGTTIHRIHPDQFAADQFNPGPKGNARFSPISDAAGKAIPTIYGGTSFECAAMETVFHDVPYAAGLKSVAKRKLKQHEHSQLAASQDLHLADLSAKALRKLGITRTDLIDSDKDIYPQTRGWAEAIHAQCPGLQGLCWVSRQDDTARAIILFEDRLPPNALSPVVPSVDIVTDSATYAALVHLADTIGVNITGK